MVAPLVVAGVLGMIALGTSPIQRLINQPLNLALPFELLDPASLIEANAFGLIDNSSYFLAMRKQGFNKNRSERLRTIAQTKLSPLDLIQLKRRGLISEEDFIKQIEMSRTNEQTTDQIDRLSRFVPGVQDTIRFAVREAYRDDIADKFGYDEDFPPDSRIAEIEALPVAEHEQLTGSDRLIAQSLQIGLDPQLLKRFWRAHWELPSVSAGLEMFHRLRPEFSPVNPVTFETVKELLKIQDIAPFWQERILETSFKLPTRVDIRRMYVNGLMERPEVFDVYQQLGFAPKWAEMLTQLADSDKDNAGRDLSRTMIEGAYEEGIINRDTAIFLLNEMKYDEVEAEIIIRLKDRELANNEFSDKLKLLKTQFIRGIIDEEAYRSSLDELNLIADKRDLIILNAKSERMTVQKLASKEDLKAFFKKAILTEKEITVELEKIGYSAQLIEWLIKSWK